MSLKITAAILFFIAATSRGSTLLPPMTNGVPSEYASRRSGAEVSAALRIEISRAGLYRITLSNLTASGVSNVVGSQLRLFCRTQEVALATSTEGAWGASDFAIFYGIPYDGYYTSTNVYWLGIGAGGLRMTSRNSAPLAGPADVTTHWATVRYDPKVRYSPTYLPLDDSFDHWFAISPMTTVSDVTFSVSTTNRTSSGLSSWTFSLYGRNSDGASPTDHLTRIVINGVTLTNFVYDGLVNFVGATSNSNSLLTNGVNTIAMKQMVSSTDNASFAWAEVSFVASNRVVQESIALAGVPGTNNYAAGPWASSNGLWILDISDTYHPVRITNAVMTNASGAINARWSDTSAGSNAFFAASTSTIIDVANPAPILFRGLTDTNRQADYILVCDTNMRRSAYTLAKYRVKQGLRVLVIPIGDIYNEFSYGIKDEGAIKQFLGYVYHHWTLPRLQYVVLAGDSSYDPKNNLSQTNSPDVIPEHLGPSGFEYCGNEGWFATVDGSDYLRDFALGRIPVASDQQLSNVVAKIMAYETQLQTNGWRKKALLVADYDVFDADTNVFRNASDTNVYPHLISSGYTVTKAYLGSGGTPTPTLTRTTIVSSVNSGTFTVSYFGHGFTDVWSAFFDTNDVANLGNTNWPVFCVLTCENGDFDNPAVESLSERLLERNQRGGIAVASAGALSIQESAEQFAYGFYSKITNTPACRQISKAVDAGFVRLYGASPFSGELLFYNLIGDPATVVNP